MGELSPGWVAGVDDISFLEGCEGVKRRRGIFCRVLMVCHCLITAHGGQVPGSAVGTHLVRFLRWRLRRGCLVAATALQRLVGA